METPVEIYDLEMYRSGHNGADSKSACRTYPARGFESLHLRFKTKWGILFQTLPLILEELISN